MELHVVVFILNWLTAASKVYWTLSNKPVIYEDNIILTCKTGHVLTDIRECRGRQWYSGHKNKLLLYNEVSENATKYEARTNLSSTEFSLVIKNYTESDLNINYTCSCGFESYTKRLVLNDEDFIVPPLRVDTSIQQSNETFSIYIHVERVYPRPQCSVVIGERTVFDKLTLTFVKRGKFYYGTYEASFDIVDDDCGKKPTLLCYIGNEYNIVNTSGEPMRNCTVYWTLSNKPVIYGDHIILTCKTGHALTDLDECPGRQWYSGHKDNLLLYNKVSRDAKKYEDRTNLSSTEFSLVIKNYTESDLNIYYTCTCGFKSYTKRLSLNDEDFIVPPLRVDTYIKQSNETLSVYIHVERVYPRPQCSVVIGERTVFDKLILAFGKRGEFYYGTYEASFNIVDDDCGKKPILLCYIGNEYSIVNTSGEPMRKCTVYWIVSNKPVIYGDNIILTCKTVLALTDSGGACHVRQWYRGKKRLLYNDVSVVATKYEDRTNVSSTEFSLVIKNYTESDLNINYTCSCGFMTYTKRLSLSDNNFIVPPLTVDTNIQQSNETLSIYIHVERVYPRPECAIVIGERTVFDKLTFTYVKRGTFYYGTFEACFHIVDDDCNKKPALLCFIGNEYNIVNTSGETIRNCTGRHTGITPGSISTSTDTYTIYVLSVLFGVSLFVLLCFFTRKIILYTWRKVHKTVSNTSDQDEPLYTDCPSCRFPVRRNRTFGVNVSANPSPASDDHTVHHSTNSDVESLYDEAIFDEEVLDVPGYLSPASNVHAVHYSNDTENNAVHLLTENDTYDMHDTE